MCTGNLPDPLNLFDPNNPALGKALPDPGFAHTPTPEQQQLAQMKKDAEAEKAAAAAEKAAGQTTKAAQPAALRIVRKGADSRKRSKRSSLRIDLQSPGQSSAGGPPTLGASGG